MSPAQRAAGAAAGLLPLYGKKGFDPMKTAWKRAILGFVSLVQLCVLALAPAAGAATKLDVGVAFWKEKAEQTSLADDGVDHDRTATLTRQPNGTYTLELPVKKLSKVNMTGRLTGLTIGDVSYDGVLSGEFKDDTAILTIKNLPASVLTGSDSSKALTVTANIKMDLQLLGELTAPTRLCVWVEEQR